MAPGEKEFDTLLYNIGDWSPLLVSQLQLYQKKKSFFFFFFFFFLI